MSRVFLISIVAVIALLAGVVFYATRAPEPEPAPVVSAAAQVEALQIIPYPSFTLPDVAGTMHDFSEWDGKHRILNFWATWCAPCRREIPLLKKFQSDNAIHGFQVIGIAVDFPEAVAKYAEAAEFNYPVLVGEQEAMAVAESSGVEFVGLPFTMFIAADGELLSDYIGELHQTQLDEVMSIMTDLDLAEISKEEARTALDSI